MSSYHHGEFLHEQPRLHPVPGPRQERDVRRQPWPLSHIDIARSYGGLLLSDRRNRLLVDLADQRRRPLPPLPSPPVLPKPPRWVEALPVPVNESREQQPTDDKDRLGYAKDWSKYKEVKPLEHGTTWSKDIPVLAPPSPEAVSEPPPPPQRDPSSPPKPPRWVKALPVPVNESREQQPTDDKDRLGYVKDWREYTEVKPLEHGTTLSKDIPVLAPPSPEAASEPPPPPRRDPSSPPKPPQTPPAPPSPPTSNRRPCCYYCPCPLM